MTFITDMLIIIDNIFDAGYYYLFHQLKRRGVVDG